MRFVKLLFITYFDTCKRRYRQLNGHIEMKVGKIKQGDCILEKILLATKNIAYIKKKIHE